MIRRYIYIYIAPLIGNSLTPYNIIGDPKTGKILRRKLKGSQQFSHSLQLLLGVKYLFMETVGRCLKKEHCLNWIDG